VRAGSWRSGSGSGSALVDHEKAVPRHQREGWPWLEAAAAEEVAHTFRTHHYLAQRSSAAAAAAGWMETGIVAVEP
jgi:hypothetical protein